MSSDDILQFIEDTKKQLGPIVKDLMLPDSKSLLFGDGDAMNQSDTALLRGDNGRELLKELEKCDPDSIYLQLKEAAGVQIARREEREERGQREIEAGSGGYTGVLAVEGEGQAAEGEGTETSVAAVAGESELSSSIDLAVLDGVRAVIGLHV